MRDVAFFADGCAGETRSAGPSQLRGPPVHLDSQRRGEARRVRDLDRLRGPGGGATGCQRGGRRWRGCSMCARCSSVVYHPAIHPGGVSGLVAESRMRRLLLEQVGPRLHTRCRSLSLYRLPNNLPNPAEPATTNRAAAHPRLLPPHSLSQAADCSPLPPACLPTRRNDLTLLRTPHNVRRSAPASTLYLATLSSSTENRRTPSKSRHGTSPASSRATPRSGMCVLACARVVTR